MKYNQSQIEVIGDELRNRFLTNQAEGTEIVVTLLAMQQAGRIDQNDLKQILLKVYMGNIEGVLRSLERATAVSNHVLIDNIVEELRRENRFKQ